MYQLNVFVILLSLILKGNILKFTFIKLSNKKKKKKNAEN